MSIELIIVIIFLYIIYQLLSEGNKPKQNTQPTENLNEKKSSDQTSPPSNTNYPVQNKNKIPVQKPRYTPRTAKPSIRFKIKRKFEPDEVFRKEYVSFTRLNNFLMCPSMFELIYLCGIEDKSGLAAQKGKLMHKILELYKEKHGEKFSQKIKSKDALNDILSFYDDAYSLCDINDYISKKDLEFFARNYIKINRNLNSTPKNNEIVINRKMHGYNFKCVIDRIDQENKKDDKVLIDYKTGQPRYVKKRQLNMYALVFSDGRYNPYKLQYQFLKTGRTKDWIYDIDTHEYTLDWMFRQIKKIENTTYFPVKPARYKSTCQFCPAPEYCSRK